MEQKRCDWCGSDPLYVQYHDTEWGQPVYSSKKLWACLVLESFQSGLSWITILRKRENFYTAFKGLDPEIISTWGDDEIERLVKDESIIRHRAKITATLTNARAWQEIEKNEGFSAFIWSFVDGTPITPYRQTLKDVPAQTNTSKALSTALKKRGFKFFGPTTAYAFMQATGMVNDHLVSCPAHRGLV